MESVKTAEVMLRGNASGNYIAINTKGELYSTVIQRDDCLKFLMFHNIQVLILSGHLTESKSPSSRQSSPSHCEEQ